MPDSTATPPATSEERPTDARWTLRPRPPTNLGALLIGREEEELVLRTLRSQDLFRYYGTDPAAPPTMVLDLEREFAAKVGTRFALAVSSGTAALEVALGALAIGPGDEVILPAWGWNSCWTAVLRAGATPVLAEVDDTLTLAPGEITRLASPRTKAVLLMHYQGVPADIDRVMAEAAALKIPVLEDCAQVCGATYRGKPAGTFGPIGTFSFQWNKYITCGEGGMVVTDDPLLFERAVRMHDLGLLREPHAAQLDGSRVPMFAGGQYRMSELHGAVALAQFRKLEGLKQHCRTIFARIVTGIRDLPGLELRRIPDPNGDTGFELYVYAPDAARAEALREALDALNVNCRKTTGSYCHYAREYCVSGETHATGRSPLQALKQDGPWPAAGYRPEDFPRTEALVHRMVALPIGSAYTTEDADYIAHALRHVWGRVVAA